jgi:hypothetical protein
MAAEGIAQVLHVGRVGDLARLQRSARCSAGERRCGLGKHVLRLRVDFPRAVASIDACRIGTANVPPPRGPGRELRKRAYRAAARRDRKLSVWRFQ